MPPKKVKDLSQAPVYGMTHEQQVKLLSEALLREYMHRRGFHQTLKAFDTENPRNDETISSRALMSDLMVLQPEVQARLKAGGVETIMEMLCELRVERRQEVQRLREAAAAEVPEVPARYTELKAKEQARLAKKAAGGGSKPVSEDNSAASEEDSGADDEDEVATPKPKKEKKEKKAKKKKENKKSKKKEGEAPKSAWASDGLMGDAHMTIEDLLGSSTSTGDGDKDSDDSGEDGGAAAGGEGGGAVAKTATGQPDWLAARRTSGGNAPGAAVAATAVAAAGGGAAAGGAAPAAATPAIDAEDLDEEELSAGIEGDAIFPGSQALPAEMGQAAYRTICGASAAPPVSFLQQGFTFDEVLEYALIQWREGPSGVLAAVQAFVIAYYFEKELYVDVPTRQRLCLRRALLTILSKAQPQPRHIVLVHGLLAKRTPERTALARLAESSTATPYMSYWTGFNTTEEVESCLDALLSAKGGWGTAKGSGLWCFLLSLVLSRGNAAVGKDMDEPAHPLLQGRAESTLELANLCLTGRATSNAYNHAGSNAHKGYIATLACGLLRAEEGGASSPTDGEEKRYTFATDSTYPSWVVYDIKKCRFSNIFMKKDTRKVFQQKKSLGGGATLDFLFWDCATEDDEVELAVVVTGTGNWGGNSRKVGANSFVAKAILTVPMWADGYVDWKGNTPVH